MMGDANSGDVKALVLAARGIYAFDKKEFSNSSPSVLQRATDAELLIARDMMASR